MATRVPRIFQNIYEILTRDLTLNDLNKSFNEDLRGMYEFYARSMKSVEGEKNKVKRAAKFMLHLFVAFLLKLSPARRFLYAVAVVFILVAITQGRIESGLYSFIIVNILLAMELADKLITKDELSIAREIQLSLQPVSNTKITGYSVATYSDVAKQVGGDYYDIIKTEDGCNLIVIGDVSGKGISSALYVVKMQTALQLFANETSDPKELLIRLNSYLYGQLKRNYFLTLFLTKLFPDGRIEICRAGHPPALLYRSAEKATMWLKPNGIAVGMAPSTNGKAENGNRANSDFTGSLQKEDVQLNTGDVLFIFTDGVSESVNKDDKEFGEDRIANLIMTYANEPVDILRECIIEGLVQHRDGADLRDDTTFILLKRE
jgi:phosphoserine phosphatase RsbU/P